MVALAPDGSALVTGSENGKLAAWRRLTTEETRRWVEENRAILPLSCADRQRYNLEAC